MKGNRAALASALVVLATLIATAAPAHAAVERRQSLAGSATGGQTRTPTPPAPGEVQLLRGFDLKYTNGDHHIRTMGVLPETDGDLAITFDDRNSDDPMQYLVNLTNVQLPGAIRPPTAGGFCSGGTCTFPLQTPPSSLYIFFLRGFELTFLPEDVGFPFPGNCNIFSGCDHHLSIVGIQRQDNSVAVTYQDQNGDDDFYASISYAYVHRDLVQRLTTVRGTVDDAGTDHKDVDTSGAVAITGFRIEYERVQCGINITCLPDNHILRFRYQLSSTGVDVAFHDNEPGTDWKYQLNFATFR
jgi:hypothetical protein